MIPIFTEGSGLGNPEAGGWAYIIQDSAHRREGFGYCVVTTNNRRETMAANEALNVLSSSRSVVRHSDSQLLIKAMTLGWKRKQNQDLGADLDQVVMPHFSAGANIRTTTVARHSPDGEMVQRFLVRLL